MNSRKYSLQQKLLIVIAVSVVVIAALFLLRLWGVQIPEDLMAKIVGTFIVVSMVAGILIAISSNMKDAKKDDNDNFFN